MAPPGAIEDVAAGPEEDSAAARMARTALGVRSEQPVRDQTLGDNIVRPRQNGLVARDAERPPEADGSVMTPVARAPLPAFGDEYVRSRSGQRLVLATRRHLSGTQLTM
jgi:hypothetical protein